MGKKGVTFLRDWGGGGWGACNFYIKNDLTSEIFNVKKSL